MVVKLPPRPPQLPVFLQRRSSDEYNPVPYTPLLRRVVSQVRAQGPKAAARLSLPLADYWSGRQGTAAALRALDQAYGGGFFNVPAEAELDRAAADAALGGGRPFSSSGSLAGMISPPLYPYPLILGQPP